MAEGQVSSPSFGRVLAASHRGELTIADVYRRAAYNDRLTDLCRPANRSAVSVSRCYGCRYLLKIGCRIFTWSKSGISQIVGVVVLVTQLPSPQIAGSRGWCLQRIGKHRPLGLRIRHSSLLHRQLFYVQK